MDKLNMPKLYDPRLDMRYALLKNRGHAENVQARFNLICHPVQVEARPIPFAPLKMEVRKKAHSIYH